MSVVIDGWELETALGWRTDDGRFYLERQEVILEDGDQKVVGWVVVGQEAEDKHLLDDIGLPTMKSRGGAYIPVLDKSLRKSINMLVELTGCSRRLVRRPTNANSLNHQYVIVGTGLNLVKNRSEQWCIGTSVWYQKTDITTYEHVYQQLANRRFSTRQAALEALSQCAQPPQRTVQPVNAGGAFV